MSKYVNHIIRNGSRNLSLFCKDYNIPNIKISKITFINIYKKIVKVNKILLPSTYGGFSFYYCCPDCNFGCRKLGSIKKHIKNYHPE